MLDKRGLRKQKTRSSIKSAALRIAGKQGWSAVTIRKIADEVLYAPPVVYEHFKDKDDLFRELVHDGFNQLTEETLSAIAKIDNPEDRLRKLFEVRFDFAQKQKTLHSMMFSTESRKWKKQEIQHAMSEIKHMAFVIIEEIASDKSKARDYFIRLIGMTIGFTYMNNHVLHNNTDKVFDVNKAHLKSIYMEAIDNLINGMKNNH